MAIGIWACITLAALAPARAANTEGRQMEWTFEEAQKCWKKMVHPIMHVGVPGYEFQTGILWDGSVVFGPFGFLELKVMQQEVAPLGNNLLELSIGFGDPMRFVDRTGTGSPNVRRGIEGGRLPMAWTETRDGDLVCHEDTFAHLLGRPMADGMKPKQGDITVTHVGITLRNDGVTSRDEHLWLCFTDLSKFAYGYKSSQSETLGNSLPQKYEAPYGVMDGKVRYVLPQPEKGSLKQHEDGRIEWTVRLKAGEEAGLRLIFPYGLVERAVSERLLALDPAKERAAVRDFWAKLQYGRAQITTPDPFINDYLVAVTGQMLQQVAYRGQSTKVWMYKTSPNHYEGYWPCNAAKALPTFDFRGLTAINEKVLQSFIDVRTDDVGGLGRGPMGSGEPLPGEGYGKVPGFMGNFGEWTANPLVLSHGLALWALAQHYRITRDDKWLRSGKVSPLQAMLDGCDWLSAQRRRTMVEENGQKVPYWGLLPGASAHDWLAGHTIFNDGFCIYGMSEVVRLLKEIGHPRAAEMQKELNDYRKCLHDRYAEATAKARPVPLPDGTTIPFVPRMTEELDWAKPDWTYTLLGPVICGAYGAIDPHDKLIDWALAFQDEGMPKGEGFYFSPKLKDVQTADHNWVDVSDPNADRHHMWRHYVEYETMWPSGWHIFLARDDLPRYFEWLFHNLSVVVHHDFRVGTESLDGVPSNAPGDGDRWQAIRAMFIHEREGYDGSEQSLWLLQAMPQSWLRPGNHLAVSKMPTCFGGTCDMTLDVAGDGNSVVAIVSLSKLAVKSSEVVMRLRSGDGRPLRSAEVNGQPATVLPGDTIKLPVVTSGKFKVVGKF